jgi:hypothetical protein
MSNKGVFDDLVTLCTTELFRASGISMEARAASPTIEYAAIIGFAADELRGMVGLGMTAQTLSELARSASGDEVDSEDWLGECVNQLLGRLKNQLLHYNVEASVTLPTVLRGVRLELRGAGPEGLWAYSFESEHGEICVWLDVRVDPDFFLARVDDPARLGVPEGELVLF